MFVVLAILLIYSCGGGGGGGGSRQTAEVPLTQGAASGLASLVVVAIQSGQMTADSVVRAAVGGDARPELVQAVVQEMAPVWPRLTQARFRNWVDLGGMEPPRLDVDHFVHELVLSVAVGSDLASEQGRTRLLQLAPRMGLAGAGSLAEAATAAALTRQLLPANVFGAAADTMLAAAHDHERLTELALDQLNESMEELLFATRQLLGNPKFEIDIYKRRLLAYAAAAHVLLSEHDAGAETGAYIQGLTGLALSGAEMANTIGISDLEVQNAIFGKIGRFFKRVGRGIGRGIVKAANWVADRASDAGDFFVRMWNKHCNTPRGCVVKSPQIRFKLQQSLTTTKQLVDEGLQSVNQRLGGIERQVGQVSHLLVGLDDKVSALTDRVTRSTVAILDAISGLKDSLDQTEERVLEAATAIRSEVSKARVDIAELRDLILWFYDQVTRSSMDRIYNEFDELISGASTAIELGQREELLSLLARVHSQATTKPSTELAQSKFLRSIPDAITGLPQRSFDSVAYQAASIGVSHVIAQLIGADVLREDPINVQALSYLLHREVELLARGRDLLGPKELARRKDQISDLLRDRRDRALMVVRQLLERASARASQLAPLAEKEMEQLMRGLWERHTLHRDVSASYTDWLLSSRFAFADGELRLPLRRLSSALRTIQSPEPGWNYRVLGQDFASEGGDPLHVLCVGGFLEPVGSSDEWDLEYRFPLALRNRSTLLASHEGVKVGRIRLTEPVPGASLIEFVNLSASTFSDLQEECATLLDEIGVGIVKQDVLPALRQPTANPSLQELAGLVSILRWTLEHVLIYAAEDAQLGSLVNSMLASPLMTGSKLFGNVHRSAGSAAEVYQAALADHVERVVDPQSKIPVELQDLSRVAQGVGVLASDLQDSLSTQLLPGLNDFYFAPIDEIAALLEQL